MRRTSYIESHRVAMGAI
uniref:Uncharacterized protein n=1 Tax=Anguilla anguilla TaxID=7936 RepID=A0A0E9XQA8_ANGAN